MHRTRPDLVRDRHAETAVALRTAKRAARSGVLWGALFGGLIFNDAVSYHQNFPTAAARETFGGNAAFAAVLGPTHRLDMVERWPGACSGC